MTMLIRCHIQFSNQDDISYLSGSHLWNIWTCVPCYVVSRAAPCWTCRLDRGFWCSHGWNKVMDKEEHCWYARDLQLDWLFLLEPYLQSTLEWFYWLFYGQLEQRKPNKHPNNVGSIMFFSRSFLTLVKTPSYNIYICRIAPVWWRAEACHRSRR